MFHVERDDQENGLILRKSYVQYVGEMTLPEKKRTDFRLSLTVLKLIAAAAKNLGIGKTHVVELAVREFVERKGIKA